MKLHPRLTCIIVWILAVTLTCTPLVAQNPQLPEPESQPESKPDEVKPASPESGESDSTQPASPAEADETKPAVAAEPVPTSEAAFPPVAKNSTTLANRSGSTRGSNGSNSPGESKWIILAALLATGATVAAILLFRGFGGGDDDEPVGTVISAGPPAVNVPNR